MTIGGTSNAAECMSILTGSRQDEKEKNVPTTATGGSFTDLFKDILSRGGSIKETPTGDLLGTVKRELYVPKTTFTEYVRSPYCESTYWREEDEYSAFLDGFQSSIAEYTDDMWSTGSNGQRTLNKEGREHFVQWRMERLQPLIPDSIEEAEQRFGAGLEHLNNYMHTMFEANRIEYDFNYQPQAIPEAGRTGLVYGTNTIGMTDYEGNAQRLRDFINSESGRNMEAMIEEVQFYGAVSKLASENSAFRDAFNEDGEAALIEYARDISATMGRVELPEVQTASNLYRQLLQPGL